MPGKVRVSITPQMKREIVKIIDERIAEAHVTKEDFSELKSIVKELAEAQKRTEEEVRKLAIGLNDTRKQLGGLSRSFSYAFENEAYRNIPKVLREKWGYEINEKMVRAEIGGKEINFFGKAKKDGKEVYIIGESKIRLDEGEWRSDVFLEIEQKINAVKTELGEIETVKLIVTHFATRGFLEEASNRGVIVIQSFEW